MAAGDIPSYSRFVSCKLGRLSHVGKLTPMVALSTVQYQTKVSLGEDSDSAESG